MKKVKDDLYYVGRLGNLKFPLRGSIARDYARPDSLFEHERAAIAVMVVCATLDFIMFKQLFSSFLYDSVAVQMLSIIGLLIGFDFAPIYAGIILKKRSQGINESLLMAGILGFGFLAALAGSIWLRITVKDLVLPDFSTSTISTFGAVQDTATMEGSSKLSLVYAVFASFLPVVTSTVSFAVSYHTSNPLKQRMRTLKMEQISIEDSIAEMDALLLEYDSDEEHLNRLLEADEERYQTMLRMIDERTVYYFDYVRERIKEHLGDPVSNNVLSKDSRGILRQTNTDLTDLNKAVPFNRKNEKTA